MAGSVGQVWAFCAVLVVGLGSLILLGCKMKEGLGPFNLRAIGIVFVGTLSALLGIYDSSALAAATGVLGAVVGYLFGAKDRQQE